MNHWRICSSCKKEIGFSMSYYECSVSTCTGQRTGYVFCSVPCWERHLPGARHRDAAAIEKKSPSQQQYQATQANQVIESVSTASVSAGQRRIVSSASPSMNSLSVKASEEDILVVISKVKSYIKSQADMNVSDDIMRILSHRIRYFCDQAIKNAQADGRKTVLDRDLK